MFSLVGERNWLAAVPIGAFLIVTVVATKTARKREVCLSLA